MTTSVRRSCHRVIIVVAAVLFYLVAGDVRAATFNWNGPGGVASFDDASNWSPVGGPPGSADEALFGIVGSHTVQFNSVKPTDTLELNVEKGNYSFRSDSTTLAAYSVTSAASTAQVSEATLNIGLSTAPVALDVTAILRADSNGTIRVNSNSSVSADDLFIGTLSGGSTNLVEVIGSGSSLTVNDGVVMGANGADAELTFNSGATGVLSKDTVLLNFTSANDTNALLQVLGGSTVTTDGIAVGVSSSTTAVQSGVLTVSGTGSTLSQTGTSGLLVGVANNPNLTAEVNVTSGGQFTSGTGNLRFRGTGALLVGTDSTFTANGPLLFESGATLAVGGMLNANQGLDFSAGSLNFFEGDLRVENGEFRPATDIDGNFVYLGAADSGLFTPATDLILGSGATFNLTGAVQIGATNRFARMRLEAGAQATTGDVDIGTLTLLDDWLGELEITGDNTQWDVQGVMDARYGKFDVADQATLLTDSAVLTTRSFSISGSADWSNAGSVDVTGGAQLSIESSATFSTHDASVVGTQVNVTGDGNLTTTGELLVSSGATVEIATGGAADTFSATVLGASSAVNVSDGSWLIQDGLAIGGSSASSLSSVRANLGGEVTNLGDTAINEGGRLTINLGTVNLDGEVSGSGSINFVFDGELNLNSPNLLLLANSTTDVLFVNDVRVDGAGYLAPGQNLSTVSELIVTTGGRFSAAGGDVQLGGLQVALGGQVTHSGGVFEVAGPVVTASGSSVIVSGNPTTTTLGDATKPNGVYIAGVFETGRHSVALLDANDAVFDSGALVTLGDELGSGELDAANGLTLDFGGNITGHGTVQTPNDPTRPLTNNGHIAGTSMAEPITLTGYVKGVGTCDNCVITGTDAPGFSPATVVRGSMSYQGVLEMEVGGLAAGQSDRIDHLLGAGQVMLGGELLIAHISGYQPAGGDVLTLITATGGISGTFATETLPAIGGGLAWDVVYQPAAVSLAVVGLAGDYNLDGQVNLADYTLWRDTLGQTGVGLAADGNGDTLVDAADYGVWKQNFGLSAAAGGLAAATVPEPASCLALLLLSIPFLAAHPAVRK